MSHRRRAAEAVRVLQAALEVAGLRGMAANVAPTSALLRGGHGTRTEEADQAGLVPGDIATSGFIDPTINVSTADQ